jgi:hypothetical protein
VSKSGGKPKGDHVTHFLGWIERLIAWNLIWKCSKDTMEKGLMMWMSSTMDRNRQEGKWLAIEHSALKWIKANNAPSKGSPGHHHHDYGEYKTKEI